MSNRTAEYYPFFIWVYPSSCTNKYHTSIPSNFEYNTNVGCKYCLCWFGVNSNPISRHPLFLWVRVFTLVTISWFESKLHMYRLELLLQYEIISQPKFQKQKQNKKLCILIALLFMLISLNILKMFCLNIRLTFLMCWFWFSSFWFLKIWHALCFSFTFI